MRLEKKKATKICVYCKKEFETNNLGKHYCSQTCRNREHGKFSKVLSSIGARSIVCLHCKKKFETKAPNPWFCSKECRVEYRKLNHITPTEENCAYCGNKFYVTRLGKICCSRECNIMLQRKNRKLRYQKNKSSLAVKDNICGYCGKRFVSGSRHRNNNFCSKKCCHSWNRAQYRVKVLDHYGRKCECCGETNPKFLTVDHVNNDGSSHRKKMSGNLCRWLVKNDFPPGFRLLCWNCNVGREKNRQNNRVCPHKEPYDKSHEVYKIEPVSLNKTKTCIFCNKEFETTNIKRIYCSLRCQYAQRYQRNKSHQEAKKEEKICGYCGKKFDSKSKAGYKHFCSRNCSRLWNCAQYRVKVLDHYGRKCECCGETNPKFLTVDHVNNDGSSHRKGLTGNFYVWLVKNDFPPGFRLLCWNCNVGRGKNDGVCPHKEPHNESYSIYKLSGE